MPELGATRGNRGVTEATGLLCGPGRHWADGLSLYATGTSFLLGDHPGAFLMDGVAFSCTPLSPHPNLPLSHSCIWRLVKVLGLG